MEMSEVYRFLKAPLKNSIRLGNEFRQSYVYEKLVSKTLICKLVFGTSNIIIHGSWDLRPAHSYLLKPRIYLKLVARTEAAFLRDKGILAGPARNAKGKLASRWQKSTSPAPIPLASAGPASAKPFWQDGEGREKQYEVRAHVKDRNRSKVRRGKEE